MYPHLGERQITWLKAPVKVAHRFGGPYQRRRGLETSICHEKTYTASGFLRLGRLKPANTHVFACDKLY